MSLSSSSPPLPKWPFVFADLAFVGAAAFIGYTAPQPLAPPAMYAIVACVLAAAIAGCVPFIVEYARRQDEALDERQRSLEALARTVNTAAEQIGIAASGFHEIAELAQKNLKDAEALPAKVSAKFSEIEGKIDAAREDDREELERELATLRASESERLEATVQKIARAAADWSKAESAGLRHVVAAKTFIAELEAKTAALKATLGSLPAQATKTNGDHAAMTDASPASAATAATTASSDGSVAGRDREIENASRASFGSAKDAPSDERASEADAGLSPTPSIPTQVAADGQAVGASGAQASPDVAVAPPKAARKPKAPKAPTAVVEKPMAEPVEAHVGALPSPHGDVAGDSDTPATPAAAAFTDEIPAKRKPAARKTSVELEPTLGLDIQDENEDGIPAASLSSDGATRLIVTAYIGIGNRMFIRGEGPGLSWEEGVPLQFVSIGKWRWETAGANAPVRFKLYKNDREECALGLDLLEPGKQQELTV